MPLSRLIRLLLFALALGVLFWVLQSLAMVYVFHEGDLAAQIFTPSPLGIWARTLVFVFLFGFAFHANHLLARREQAETALRENEERYRQLVELSPDGIVVQSEDRIVFINSAGATLFGATAPDQLIGKSIRDFVLPEQQNAVAECYPQTGSNNGGMLPLEEKIVRADGSCVYAEVVGTPHMYKGQPAIQSIFRDVTQRKRIESELMRLRKAVETSGEVIFLTDQAGLITFINPEFTRLYGYTAEETIGATTPRILKSGALTAQDYERFWETLLSKQIAKVEFVNRRKDGILITVEGSANPILDENQCIVGFLAIQRDITERKRAEEEIRQRNKELAALNAIAATVNRSLDLNQILHDALEEVLRLKIVGEQAYGMMFFLEETSQTLHLTAQHGTPDNHPCLLTPIHMGECLCGRAIQQGDVIVSCNSSADERHTRGRPEMPQHQDICVPLAARGRKLGVMEIRLPMEYTILDSDIRLLKAVADQIGVAIENAQLRELRERAIVEERERIARELHDGVAQLLGYVNTKATAIRLLLEERNIQEAENNLSHLEEATQRLFVDVREAILGLKMSGQITDGLVLTLRGYVAQFSRLCNLPVEVIIPLEVENTRLGPETELQVLRIIQAALSNVRQHAAATRASVALRTSDNTLELTVTDDGCGFDPATPPLDHRPHFGLDIMQERATVIGGAIVVDSAPGEGTLITVTLPITAL